MAKKRRSKYAPGGGKTSGSLETAQALISGLPAEGMAVLSGILKLASMRSQPDSAPVLKPLADSTRQAREKFSFKPETAESEQQLASIAKTLEPITNITGIPGNFIEKQFGPDAREVLETSLSALGFAAPPGVGYARQLGRRENRPSKFNQAGMLYGKGARGVPEDAARVKVGGEESAFIPPTDYKFDKAIMDLTDEKYPRLKSGKLKDVVDYPTLFKHYPQLKNTDFKVVDGVDYKGQYDPSTDTISINRQKFLEGVDPAQITLHEMRHNAQKIDQTTGGTNLLQADSRRSKQLGEMEDQIFKLENTPEYREKYKEVSKEMGVPTWAEAFKMDDIDMDEFARLREPVTAKVDEAMGIDKLKAQVENYGSTYDTYRRNAGELESSGVEAWYEIVKELRSKGISDEAIDALMKGMSPQRLQDIAEDAKGYKWDDAWRPGDEAPGVAAAASKYKLDPEEMLGLIKKQGGFSINPRTGEQAQGPGIMMGQFKNEDPRTGVFKDALSMDPAKLKDEIDKWSKNTSDLFDVEGNYAGGWLQDGKDLYLDASRKFTTPLAAAKEGERTGQLAGFDLDTGNDTFVRQKGEPIPKGRNLRDLSAAMDSDLWKKIRGPGRGTGYRGLPDVNNRELAQRAPVTWLSKDNPKYADQYAGPGGTGPNMTKIDYDVGRGFDFGYRDSSIHVKKKDMLDRIKMQTMRDFEAGKITQTNAEDIMQMLADAEELAPINMKSSHRFYDDPDLVNPLKALGFDHYKGREGPGFKTDTVGLFRPPWELTEKQAHKGGDFKRADQLETLAKLFKR